VVDASAETRGRDLSSDDYPETCRHNPTHFNAIDPGVTFSKSRNFFFRLNESSDERVT
jgi:hypothetical protein